MPIKNPIVLSSGAGLQELQAGDTLSIDRVSIGQRNSVTQTITNTATLDLTAVDADVVVLNGTSITSIVMNDGQRVQLVIGAAMTIATTNFKPLASITAAINDVFNLVQTGSTTRVESYSLASGQAFSSPGGSPSLDLILGAAAGSTINSADNPIVWNWMATTAVRKAFTIGENTASTGGSGNQILFCVGTLAGSTAEPLVVQSRGVDALRISRFGAITLSALNGTAGSGAQGSSVSIDAGAGAASNAGGSIVITSGSGGTSAANGNITLNLGTNNSSVSNGGALSSNAKKITLGGTLTAGYGYQTAIGYNSNNQPAVCAGEGAVALGGSYASGNNSFAAATGNNTGTYGALSNNCVSIGYQSKAGGITSFAFGASCNTTSSGGMSLGGSSTAQGGNYAMAFGYQANANAIFAMALGYACQAASQYALALGASSLANNYGKMAFASGQFAAQGDAQYGSRVLRGATTGAAVVTMTSDGAAAGAANQFVVATGQAVAFTGTLIGKQTASANIAAYTISGTMVNNGGTATMPTGTLTLIGTDTIGLTTAPTLSIDTTNKALSVKSGNKTATNIRWVCQITSSEVTYA